MARIRSIKPEFPQSESMGRVSRDARLTFVQLWTISDDEGRLRGNSRMLASLLFPYDDDASNLIEVWLGELEREECIVRYKIGTQSYIQLCNWLIHQKIDKPTKSKIPAFDESSREVSNTLETSSEEGKGREGKGEDATLLVATPSSRLGELCILLRRAGVNTSPDAIKRTGWSENSDITDNIVLSALNTAKKRSPNKITPNYLAPIISQLLEEAKTVESMKLVAGKDYI